MIVLKLGDAVLLANTVDLAQDLIKKSLDASLDIGVTELHCGQPTEEELRVTRCVLEMRGVPK